MWRLKGLGRGLPLYGALLVLPAIVLMVLHGLGLYSAYTSDNEVIPLRAESSRLRLAELLHERFLLFIDGEQRRPYYQYGQTFSPAESVTDDLVLLPSPLLDDPVPPHLEAWFHLNSARGLAGTELELVANAAGAQLDGGTAEDYQQALAELVEREGDAFLTSAPQRGAEYDRFEIPLVTAAVHADRARHEECLRACLPVMQGRNLAVGVSRFRMFMFRDLGGELRLAAIREVIPDRALPDLSPELPKGGTCMDSLRTGFHFVQGFFIDPDWALEGLAEELAPLVLDRDTRLVVGSEARRPEADGELRKRINLYTLFDIDTAPDLVELGTSLAIVSDITAPRARFAAAILRFGAVGIMLVLSLGTGLLLLLGNVRQKLEQARRTENFVAAVTHELRTPLASIRLHGEMLQDGIASTPEARNEYYNRILGETERLTLLVENVLQKSQLDSERAGSEPGDLSHTIELLADQVRNHGLHHVEDGDGSDLIFELAKDLPPVALHPDALNGILRNLVGNARKYAATQNGAQPEPITVRTSFADGVVLLEVLDRGPGVAPAEQAKIFEAFYRTGDEATREKPGTGLGLHLVDLHAQALGARVGYRARPGGGSIFVVEFPPSRGGHESG